MATKVLQPLKRAFLCIPWVPNCMQNLKVWKFSFPNLFDSYRDSLLTLLPDVFKSLIQNLEVKYSVNFSRIMAHKNTRVFSHDKVENKLFKASVFWMNDSRIHRNMKIARDDSTAKLGCSDWCDFPLNASERISEQALIFSLEGRPM